jgi:glycosyltransferase involved in cell wall biosynthesis
MKKSIAIVLENKFDPNAGGVQQSTSKMAKLFKEKGHEILIVSMRGENKGENLWNDILLFNCPSENKENFLNELFIKKEVNIVINQSGFIIELNSLLRKVLPSDAKLLCTLRFNPLNFVDNYEITIQEFFKSKGIGFMCNSFSNYFILKYHLLRQNYWYRKILKTVDFMIILSESYKNEIYQLSPSSRKYDNKISAIPNLFPISNFHYDYNEKENVILYVGRLNITEKRVDILLDIWHNMHSKLPNWQFWVVGYGPEEENMKKYCLENNLDRVKFFGKQKPNEYYAKARLLHFTSASEGFPNVLLEAQRFAVVPVLFNSYSAAKDIIEDGINGCLITPFEKESFIARTNEIIDRKDLQIEMANNSLENSKRFSYDAVYEKWLKLFESK